MSDASGATASPPRRVALLLAFGFAASLLVLQVGLGALLGGAYERHPRSVLAVIQVGGLLLPSLLALAFLARRGLEPPRWSWPAWRSGTPWLVPASISSFILAACLIALWIRAVEATGPGGAAWLAEAQLQALEIYGPLMPGSGLDAVSTVLVVPIVVATCEEIAFRGVIQRLLDVALGPAWAILTTAVAFATFHVEPIGFLARMFLGATFGLVLARTGSILPCVILHAMHDAMTLLAAGLAGSEAVVAGDPIPQAPLAIVALALIVGLAAWLASMRALGRPA